MKKILFISCLFLSTIAFAQNNAIQYKDSLQRFRLDYVATHDIVKGADTVFLKFFPIDEAYKVIGIFERMKDSIGFIMQTSSGIPYKYFKYGRLTFTLNNKPCQLFIYQADWMMKLKQYKDFLFLPFTDLTSGIESHGSGRYIDFTISDIKNNTLEIDFNKCYNPSCAYKEGFSCPIPPKENDLPVAINAGEKLYGKPYSK